MNLMVIQQIKIYRNIFNELEYKLKCSIIICFMIKRSKIFLITVYLLVFYNNYYEYKFLTDENSNNLNVNELL